MSPERRCQALFTRLDPGLVKSPYDLFDELRKAPPQWVPAVQAVAVTRFEQVREVIGDAATFSSAEVQGPLARAAGEAVSGALAAASAEARELAAENAFLGRLLLTADGEEHRSRRALVARAFTPTRIRAMEPVIREIAERLTDAFIGAGRVEFVSAFAAKLPVAVIARAYGVDEARFSRWCEDIVAPVLNSPDPELTLRLLRSQHEFTQHLRAQVETRRTAPRDDLLQDLLDAELDGRRLTPDEILEICAEMLVAGNPSTTSMLAGAIEALGRDRRLFDAVAGDVSLIPALLEETLRREAPVQGFYRTATRDAVIGGVAIEAGTAVLCLYSAANRDPAEFPHPGQIDLGRPNAGAHLAFGHSAHACLGAPLARAQGRIALEVLLERIGRIEAVDPPRAGQYASSYILRVPQRLELSFTRRAHTAPAAS
jgi:cytochrome P450